jgi:hypothetical protein
VDLLRPSLASRTKIEAWSTRVALVFDFRLCTLDFGLILYFFPIQPFNDSATEKFASELAVLLLIISLHLVHNSP